MDDGTVMYNYYEKDGSLYGAITGKGGNVSKYKLLEDETTYDIDKFDNTQIVATIIAKWETVNGEKYTLSDKLTLIGDGSDWKINGYESELITN